MKLEDHILSLPNTPALDVLGKFVFLRNARTGTTSMCEGPLRARCLLSNRNIQIWRTAWDEIIMPKVIMPSVDEVVFFTFVRNTWDRICSAFYHCRDRAKAPENQIEKSWEFNDWTKRVLAVQGPNVNRHFAEQYPSAYFNDKPIDFIGRFENMRQDWSKVAEMIGVPGDLPHSNSSGHGCYVDHYDDESREIIGELYRRDIQAFHYEFGKTETCPS